jgi:ABC-type glycerol-3-phosphate transport system substrate-binding protein
MFKDTYITEAELFLSKNGVLAVPFGIDPLIMYWNRDLFSSAGIANPPHFWDEFLRLAESLTVKGDSVTIAKSAVPLGEFSNITNAKEIISAMTLQTGAPITAYNTSGSLAVSLTGYNNSGLQNVVDFYTEFANPVKSVYTWNRSLPNSLSMFAAGGLGVYFGFASELSSVKSKNPNLDFDISYFPQPREAQTKITYGKVFGTATLRSSVKVSSAMQLALLFGSAAGVKAWDDASGLPPVRRDLLSSVPSNAYGAILYNSALWSRGWLDPDSSRTKGLFRDMIEGITSGWMTTSEAVGKFNSQMNLLLSGQ